jgi:hypothetical protein
MTANLLRLGKKKSFLFVLLSTFRNFVPEMNKTEIIATKNSWATTKKLDLF